MKLILQYVVCALDQPNNHLPFQKHLSLRSRFGILVHFTRLFTRSGYLWQMKFSNVPAQFYQITATINQFLTKQAY